MQSDLDTEKPRKQTSAPIDGHCDPAFAAVEAAFRENFETRDEVGAGICVRIDGRVIVDLWGGHQDETRRIAWQRDTLVNAYSVGKGITAMLALSLVERGELALDEPVTRLWPEFGVEGKSATTLRMLLAHQAGLPGVRRELDANAIYDWREMTNALASQAPYWEPGEAHGYHVNTYGFLVGEPICRRLGQTFSSALRERLTGPIQADFHIGLPVEEHRRVAPILPSGPPPAPMTDALDGVRQHFVPADAAPDPEREEMLAKAYFNPPGLSGFGVIHSADWRSASIPSTNGHGTARAVAELYDLFLNREVARGGLVGAGLRREARQIESDGIDRVLGKPSQFGLGFQLSQPSRPIGRSEASFGHFGYGGTLGFADPEAGLAFGYLMNRPGERWLTPRTNTLVDAVYSALGRSPSSPPEP